MKKKYIAIMLSVISVISTSSILLTSPSDKVKKPSSVNPHSAEKIITPDVKSLKILQVTSDDLSVKKNLTLGQDIVLKEPNNIPKKNHQVKAPVNTQTNKHLGSNNPAAQFNNLSQEIQNEIKTLNGRNNKNIQPIEIQPGVFIMPKNKRVRVIPVAVMNEDGTVSTYEY